MRSLLILAILALAGAAGAEEVGVDTAQIRYVMGTTATVRAWAADSTVAEAAVEAAFAAFDRVDRLMSTWRDDSNLMALNGAPPEQWVDVGAEVCQVLAEAKKVARLSAGSFDPTVLPLLRLWGFRGPKVGVPDSLSLARVLEKVDHELLEIDSSTGRARLMASGMEVDLGGIAKGWALDCAKDAMKSAGATDGVLDLGGNVLVFGPEPRGQVGIVNPGSPGELLATVPVVEGAAATSGQYERFLTIEGRQYGHILDPRSGWPVTGRVSATVVAKQAVLADALATAAVVLGPERGLELLQSIPGVEGVLAVADGQGGFSLVSTPGFVLSTAAP